MAQVSDGVAGGEEELLRSASSTEAFQAIRPARTGAVAAVAKQQQQQQQQLGVATVVAWAASDRYGLSNSRIAIIDFLPRQLEHL